MIGKTISRYRVVAKLGAGGMGEVYLAEDTELGREVALKILPPLAEISPERLERFRREARAVASLNHPNIVTLFTVEEAEGQRLLVMERVQGTRLDRLIPPGGMPLAEVFAFAIPMADALAAAHGKGITHRDLKPANVMVTKEGQIKVLDFGLAKLEADAGPSRLADAATQAPTQSAALTSEGTVLGTAPYMSPEQLKGVAVDSRSDIFSFGIVVYEMVTGKRPFQGDSGIELASSILKDTPAPVVQWRADLPRHLGRIIEHCLEKDPEQRYQSAKDVRNELEWLRKEVDSGASAPTPSSPSGPQADSMAGMSEDRVQRPASDSLDPARAEVVSSLDELPPIRRRSWTMIGLVAVMGVAIALGVLWWLDRGVPGVSREADSTAAVATTPMAGPQTIAVLPFAHIGADAELDYLRLAVPDEIATALSRGAGLAIRPFSATSRVDIAATDPATAGRDLGVMTVVTGQYLEEGDRLSLTLEAIDVAANSVVWRDGVVVGSQELLTLRQAVAEKVGKGLMSALSPEVASTSTGTLPTSPEAYDLYLRSLPLSSDPGPNTEALDLVKRAVELDPGYAPAWDQLARRYHFYASYGGGTEEDYDRAVAACDRTLALDPELSEARVRKIVISVERGKLVSAYEAGRQLVEERPRAARAHFVLAYVLRYGGAIEKSVEACDTALALDPRNPGLRSCGFSNILVGRYDWAMRFLELSPDNDFYWLNVAILRVRQGRLEEALEAARRVSNTILTVVLEPRVEGRPIDREALQREIEAGFNANDAEQIYQTGAIVAFGGAHAAGLQLLELAIARGYCADPYFDTDPMFADLRSDPDLAEGVSRVRAAARTCHEDFLTATGLLSGE